MSEPRIKVEERERRPEKGLRMILSQEATFPKPIRAWNPETGVMETKAKMDTLFDASISEAQYANYEVFSVGRESKERILILLASLGYSYPTTAIAEASGVARSTSKRVLWEMRRDGLLEGAFSHGTYIDSELWPYRYGPLRENYYMLTEKGAEEAGKLMTTKVIPFQAPVRAVEEEMKEHPWVSRAEAERLVRDHAGTMKRARELREKEARGINLTEDELRFLYGSEVPREKAQMYAFREQRLGMVSKAPVGVITPAERKVLEELYPGGEAPWERSARIAEETRRKMEESK